MSIKMKDEEMCDTMLAKLNDIMRFLKFAKLQTAGFNGVITFMFRSTASDKCGNSGNISCIRTVDMRKDIQVFTAPLPPTDPFLSNVTVVTVSLVDFLFMYSGEASAGEIATMCMSGRVAVPWTSYGELKAFADSFDFSSEKWAEYDAFVAADQSLVPVSSLPPCTKSCCRTPWYEEIDANWLLVSDTTSKTSHHSSDWEVVSDYSCHAIPTENRAKMEEVFGVNQIEEWLSKLYHTPARNRLQSNLTTSLSDLKQFAGKLFV